MTKRVWDEERQRYSSYDSRKVKPKEEWHGGFPILKCPDGYHLVRDHFRNLPHKSSMATEIEGCYVGDYCAKNPKRRKNNGDKRRM